MVKKSAHEWCREKEAESMIEHSMRKLEEPSNSTTEEELNPLVYFLDPRAPLRSLILGSYFESFLHYCGKTLNSSPPPFSFPFCILKVHRCLLSSPLLFLPFFPTIAGISRETCSNMRRISVDLKVASVAR